MQSLQPDATSARVPNTTTSRSALPVRALAALSTMTIAASAGANVIYVAASAAPGGGGQSWASAFASLQDALAIATSGDEIRIAQGTYRPGPPGSPLTATFLIASDITLQGGYAGPGAPNPDLRDPQLTPTILSGDLSGNDAPNWINRNDNAWHIVRIPGGAPTLEGLTFRGGFADGGFADRSGGAIFATDSSPVILNCLFTDNDTDNTGAAIHTSGGAARIEACRFLANRGRGGGGGIYAALGSAALVRDCLFEANIGGIGAGVYNHAAAARFERCTFRGNIGHFGGNSGVGFMDREGGAVLVECDFTANTTTGGGGAFFSWASDTTLINCRFVGNVGQFDGGGAFYASGAGHQRLVNCLFTGNSSRAGGGAALINSGAVSEFINCTIINNTVDALGFCGGAAATGSGRLELRNSILWANFDPQLSVQGSQVITLGSATLLVERCIVQGWTGSLGGIMNSGADPLLTDADGPDNIPGTADDDARLRPGSPAVDSSDNTRLPSEVLTDLDGSARFRDDTGVPDQGVSGGAGGTAIADRGCYEFQGTSCYANCDLSTVAPMLNIADFTCFLQRFAAADPYANCDGSTTAPTLNVADFTCFLQAFAQGCPAP